MDTGMKPEICKEFEALMDEMTLDRAEVKKFTVEFVSGDRHASKILLNNAKEAMNEGLNDLAKDGHIASIICGEYNVKPQGKAFKHTWSIDARVIVNHFVQKWARTGHETPGKVTVKKQKTY